MLVYKFYNEHHDERGRFARKAGGTSSELDDIPIKSRARSNKKVKKAEAEAKRSKTKARLLKTLAVLGGAGVLGVAAKMALDRKVASKKGPEIHTADEDLAPPPPKPPDDDGNTEEPDEEELNKEDAPSTPSSGSTSPDKGTAPPPKISAAKFIKAEAHAVYGRELKSHGKQEGLSGPLRWTDSSGKAHVISEIKVSPPGGGPLAVHRVPHPIGKISHYFASRYGGFQGAYEVRDDNNKITHTVMEFNKTELDKRGVQARSHLLTVANEMGLGVEEIRGTPRRAGEKVPILGYRFTLDHDSDIAKKLASSNSAYGIQEGVFGKFKEAVDKRAKERPLDNYQSANQRVRDQRDTEQAAQRDKVGGATGRVPLRLSNTQVKELFGKKEIGSLMPSEITNPRIIKNHKVVDIPEVGTVPASLADAAFTFHQLGLKPITATMRSGIDYQPGNTVDKKDTLDTGLMEFDISHLSPEQQKAVGEHLINAGKHAGISVSSPTVISRPKADNPKEMEPVGTIITVKVIPPERPLQEKDVEWIKAKEAHADAVAKWKTEVANHRERKAAYESETGKLYEVPEPKPPKRPDILINSNRHARKTFRRSDVKTRWYMFQAAVTGRSISPEFASGKLKTRKAMTEDELAEFERTGEVARQDIILSEVKRKYILYIP